MRSVSAVAELLVTSSLLNSRSGISVTYMYTETNVIAKILLRFIL